jgi:predicted branched-subunit amino acid permease
LTDESFATTIVHYRDTRIDNEHKHWYFLGANLGMFIPWQIDTAVGYSIGSALGDPLALGLDFAMSAVFIAILIPQLRTRVDMLSAMSAGVSAVMLSGLPSKLGLLIAIGIGILVGLGVETWNSRS